ncbi:hypothetical protein E2C01_084097 [Portunus trituberculatus]|uniref:Uncharacterized protein n=1 Tax=Portunus trituberculatus TaxID=210409 RepID=A0A5B7IZ10_PORTR|nr:hypothetical protein [Portunus trituberculatus]
MKWRVLQDNFGIEGDTSGIVGHSFDAFLLAGFSAGILMDFFQAPVGSELVTPYGSALQRGVSGLSLRVPGEQVSVMIFLPPQARRDPCTHPSILYHFQAFDKIIYLWKKMCYSKRAG